VSGLLKESRHVKFFITDGHCGDGDRDYGDRWFGDRSRPLPGAPFPTIFAPPEIRCKANYPGRDANTLDDAVAVPLEQQVKALANSYMYS